MFKDEAGGKVIDEFVGLRAKWYSYKMLEGKVGIKCKGVKNRWLKRVLHTKIIKSVCLQAKNNYEE